MVTDSTVMSCTLSSLDVSLGPEDNRKRKKSIVLHVNLSISAQKCQDFGYTKDETVDGGESGIGLVWGGTPIRRFPLPDRETRRVYLRVRSEWVPSL